MKNPDFEQLELSLDDLRFVNVVGTSGVGKSTFAKQLGAVLGHPHIEMDLLYWGKNWTEPGDKEFQATLKQALNNHSAWVLDGNYMSKTEAVKWHQARTVIWIDYSFLRTIRQATKRAISRAASKTELWPNTGNRESFRRSFFSTDSVVLWTLTSFYRIRKRYKSKMADSRFGHLKFVRLTTPVQAREFLAHVRILHEEK